MNKKESDRLKAAAKKQYQLQQSMLETATSNKFQPALPSGNGEVCCEDYSRYFVWGTAVLLVMIFVIL